MDRETIFALTSLSPPQGNASVIQDCIRSWRNAGLKVRAFNHPKEIVELSHLYDVEFVPIAETTAHVFGKHYIPIKVMLHWAATQNVPALLINSDIYLGLADWEIKRAWWLCNNGLCYFVRYNHDGDTARASREGFGIDAFLFHGRTVGEWPDSFLSMGQPFWDYWLPYSFATRNLPITSVEFPAMFHRRHQNSWSWENWHRCAIEFGRITGELESDLSLDACIAMSLRVRQNFDSHKISLPQHPVELRAWVRQRFNTRGAKTFLELGAHQGTDTAWMAEIPDVTVHAFEPDPRNHQAPRHNVVLHHEAIAERDGRGFLVPSVYGWGQEWTHSSSIKQPKNHLYRFPVTFGEPIEVQWITLDTFCQQEGLGFIDFIWADVQGAEGEMIRGGRRTLARTRYLYTEYSDDEMYEDQATLREILELLPDFRVVELWPDDVLLENRKLMK
jgi:FkbM family methyltransferase